MSEVFVYEWLTSRQFLAWALFPEAVGRQAGPEDTVDGILAGLPADARFFLFHLNCTITRCFPRSRDALVASLAKRGVTVLNAQAVDISKRTIQQRCAELGLRTTLAGPDGAPDEPVIVKTNLNFGGDSEWALTGEQRASLGIGKGSNFIWKPNHYKILPRRQIDPDWWNDESLICERYIDNRLNRCYRAYLFCSRLVVCRLVNPAPIKKMDQSTIERAWEVTMDPLAPVPADCPPGLLHDIRRFIQAFPLDLGTVDVMESDAGEFYVIDVNTTPAYNYPVPGLVEYLRPALETC